MTEDERATAWGEGHKVGYAVGYTDGTATGYTDAKNRAYNAVESLREVRLPNLKDFIGALRANLGNRA